ILCDALSYARRFKPTAVIDAATLTGAVVVALGHVAIGEMGNDETLLAEVREAGERAGERCWPLPLWDEYRELLKSDIADVKNSGGRGAGAIAGGAEVAAAQVDTTARRAPTAARDTAARDTTRRDTTAARDTTPRLLPAFPAPLPVGPAPRGTRYSFPIDSLVFANVRTLSDLL